MAYKQLNQNQQTQNPRRPRHTLNVLQDVEDEGQRYKNSLLDSLKEIERGKHVPIPQNRQHPPAEGGKLLST